MSRHNVFVSLSRPQAEYLLDVIGHDISESGLDPDETVTAEGAQRKIDRALGRVNARVKCGPDCKCRRHDADESETR